jgi:hypothetical protein
MHASRWLQVVFDLTASEGVDVILANVCVSVDEHVRGRVDDISTVGEGEVVRT